MNSLSKQVISRNNSKILIKGGTLIEPGGKSNKPKDIWIAEKKIVAIGSKNSFKTSFIPDIEIDATNKIVCSGLVDCSVEWPDLKLKGDNISLSSELEAAAAGGITRAVFHPDTLTPLDEPVDVEMLIYKAEKYKKSHVHPLGALTKKLSGKKITEMAMLSQAGCIGFTQANYPITDTQVLMRALQYAGGLKYPVWLKPIDPWLGLSGVAHNGSVATRLGLSGVPVESETLNILTALELARSIDVKLHFCRVSSERGIQLIRQAKSEGLRVTADVGVHHLHFTHFDIGDFDSNSKVIPPFRTQRDKEALTNGLLDGTVDCICSDHTPVDRASKNLPFADALHGLMGLELLLPLTLKWAGENKVTLHRALSYITSNSSKLIGMNDGDLEVGNRADICVFDESENWIINSSNLKTNARNNPLYGYEIKGRVQQTIVDGKCIYNKEKETG